MVADGVKRSIWIGYDPRETMAFAIARMTCRELMRSPIRVNGLLLADLERQGLYRRGVTRKGGQMFDGVTGGPMSTEHANARFFVPMLAQTGWALFTDGDVLFRENVGLLFDQLDPAMAAYCVKHNYQPTETTKMDGQIQTKYPRKNWTSVIAFNCDHPSNAPLFGLDFLNKTPGLELHALCWLQDEEIGALDPKWNHLVGVHDPKAEAAIVHFTSGVPDMPGYETQPHAEEWFAARDHWIRRAA